MVRNRAVLVVASIVNVYFGAATVAAAQVRTTGQVAGTVRDASGGVVPNADLMLQDAGTGLVLNAKSDKEGGFTFPNLQPGKYVLTAVAQGFQSVTVDNVVVETSRATDVTVKFEVAGVQEKIQVEGRLPVIQTTSNTVSTTVNNAEIAKLPLSGRNILNFALLTPGAATSSDGRFSTFNGLPGGAINITLDGINNNSQRFKSGGTSFFTFAPERLGAIEEVTVQTAGLTADAGAEGAVQVQFVTKRGTNDVHWQVFDQFRNDALNSNTWFNAVRGLPKPKLHQNEWGANVGGPLKKGKLFYFANFEQIIAPSTSPQQRTVLTPEAQQGVFRYTATDGSIRTVNLLDIARANGLPSAIDPFIAQSFSKINPALAGQNLLPSDLLRNNMTFIVPTNNRNVYPTGRVDWQATPKLAVRGILNLQWRDFTRNPQFPGLPDVNGGFASTYYILSTGADWSPRNNLFNQLSVGIQSNHEEFNPGNKLGVVYGGLPRVPFPLSLTTVYPTGDLMPQPRNNPVYNIVDTVTLLRSKHTYTMGATFRRTTMWETIGGNSAAGPSFNLGVAAGDPASAAFTATTIPGVRSADLPDALSLYALLTGRISSISGSNNVDESSHQYFAGPVTRREGQNVGGLFGQDQWRLTPRLTLNYGLRWEFTGAAYNRNGIYTSPTLPNLYGPSTALFQPGTLNGVADPQIDLRPHPYKRDFINPAPNGGFAWNPTYERGLLGRLLGAGKSVIRGGAGINYYDEGLIAFQTVAGGNPGLSQSITLNPGQPGFAPGGLLLSSSIPPLSTFPASFSFPLPESLFTFTRGFTGLNPNIRTPYVANWNVGLQRELWAGAAVEARYVGNHGFHIWREYDLNEVNVVENGFADEFKNAQRNLEINTANGRTGFANNGLPGQSALPIFDAAFGARGSQPALASASGYTNGSFITLLQQGQAGALAQQLAGTSVYLCRMLGDTFSPCSALGYNAPGPYPENFFQLNPFAAGRTLTVLNDDGWSRYNGVQLQFRQRYRESLTMTVNYAYSRAWSNRYSDSPATSVTLFTNRDDSLNTVPHIFDLRHAFQTYWTYQLPFGSDRHFTIRNPIANQVLGGWALSGIARVQSGRPFFLSSGRSTFNNFENGVVLAPGVTVSQLQSMVGVFPGPNGTKVFFDPRLIGPDRRANPQYLLSPTTPGQLGQRVFLYGPRFWNVDMSIAKRFTAPGGRVYANFEALFLDLFNNNNFLVGGTSSDSGFGVSINSQTFGQTTSTASGPRNVQLRLLIGF